MANTLGSSETSVRTDQVGFGQMDAVFRLLAGRCAVFREADDAGDVGEGIAHADRVVRRHRACAGDVQLGRVLGIGAVIQHQRAGCYVLEIDRKSVV